MAEVAIGVADYLRLIRSNRNFRLLWSAQIVSELGDWFYSVAIFSFLLQVLGTAQSVAFAFMLQVLPQCIVAPSAGVINDRMSRKRVMIFADWMRAGIVIAMVSVRSREMIWLLYLLLFCETVMWALFEPARSSVIPNITEGSEVVVANALSSTTWSFNFAIGSGLGGLAAAFWGREAVFIINSLSFVLSATLITRMHFAEPHTTHLPPMRMRDLADFTPIAEGARYIMHDARLAATLLVKAGLSFMGTNWVIIPIMGERLFPVHVAGFNGQQASTLGMSVMLASRGAGAIAGSLATTSIFGQSKPRLRFAILAGFLLASFGYMALAGVPNIWLACMALIVAHAGGSIIWTASTSLLMDQTDDKFRGRVFSTEFAFSMGTLAVINYSGGLLVDSGVSVRTLAFVTGLLVLAPAMAWAYAQRLWPRPV